jgi:hypothetical protein
MRAMRFGTTSSRFTAWLAILAMALNALWPLIANAKPAGVSSLFEVCTSQGIKSVAGDSSQAPEESGSKHLQPHCPLCSFGTDKVSAPPSAPLYFEPAAITGCGPSAEVRSALPRSDLRSPAHPRAPPAHS